MRGLFGGSDHAIAKRMMLYSGEFQARNELLNSDNGPDCSARRGSHTFSQQYDLVLRGAHAINRANSIDAIMDVTPARDRIAAVRPGYRRGFGTSSSESV
jgi:hypothetical protein